MFQFLSGCSSCIYAYVSLTFLSVLSVTQVQSQVVINELMQSNVDCIMDDINEFPDSWVELYNAGTDVVNLASYSVSDSDNPSSAWKLPDIDILPGGYTIIYCDKAAVNLHTDFRLDSGKGAAVYLFRDGQIVDEVSGLKKQPAPNIAYGRKVDNDTKWGYQKTPTPGAANCGTVLKDILANPLFSENGRVVTEGSSLSVALSVPEGSPEGTFIVYSTDGTEPQINGLHYVAPLTFSSTTTLRAKLVCDGYLSPRSVTQSYIFFPRQLTLPVVSIVTDSRYFYDDKIGIYVQGSYDSNSPNFEHDWRRPVNIELFEHQDEESVINQLCETRIQGGASRGNQIRSLAIYANKRFGEKRFSYEFFPEQKPGITQFKSFLLRNAGNDFDYLYMRDAIIQRNMSSHVDIDWQGWKPAIVYINGKYIGLQNIRERSNEDNIYSNYDGLEDIDMIENWYDLKTGSWDAYNQFAAFYNEHNHTLAEYAEYMDWEEFLNVMIMNIYYNNQDFPGNNIVMWRPRTEDGRWRWIVKDTDFGLGLYGCQASYNTIEWLYNPAYDNERNWANQYEHTRLFRRLMEDKDFEREFIDRLAIYMGDFLNEKGTREVWDPMYDSIKVEYPYHRKLINEWWPNYNDELSFARSWIRVRANYMYNQIRTHFKIGYPYSLTVNTQLTDEVVETTMNGIKLSKGVFDGKFFKDRQLTITGKKADGTDVNGWKVEKLLINGTTETSYVQGPTYIFNMPNCSVLNITALTKPFDAINDIRLNDWKWSLTDDNHIILSDIQRSVPVAIYNLQGMLIYKGMSSGDPVNVKVNAKGLYFVKVGNDCVKIRL